MVSYIKHDIDIDMRMYYECLYIDTPDHDHEYYKKSLLTKCYNLRMATGSYVPIFTSVLLACGVFSLFGVEIQ